MKKLTRVGSVAFSPDGKVLASGGYNGVIILWDRQNSVCLRTFCPLSYLSGIDPNGVPIATLGIAPSVPILFLGKHIFIKDDLVKLLPRAFRFLLRWELVWMSRIDKADQHPDYAHQDHNRS